MEWVPSIWENLPYETCFGYGTYDVAWTVGATETSLDVLNSQGRGAQHKHEYLKNSI